MPGLVAEIHCPSCLAAWSPGFFAPGEVGALQDGPESDRGAGPFCPFCGHVAQVVYGP